MSNIDAIKGKLPFWDHLEPDHQEILINNAVTGTYQKGEYIHSPDIQCTGMLIIKRGRLSASILSDEGREVTLYRLDPGEVCILSASCVLSNINFDVYVEAEEDSEILLIRSEDIEELSKNVHVENFLLNEAVGRFSDVMWALQQRLFMKFDQRLAIFLLDEISKKSTSTVTLTQEQIAKHMGSAREVVSRMLKYFSKEGLVELSRGKVTVLNKKGLRDLLEA